MGRTFAVLEVVAERGGATAKEIGEVTGLPLPTVYRLVRELIDGEYLVHIREDQRFELGYKLHALGVSLHRQVGVPREVRPEVQALHDRLQRAAYLAVHRGSQIVVVHVHDSPRHPRLQPMGFGFHEAPHATAFGKILLGSLSHQQRRLHLDEGDLPAITPQTITDRDLLDAHLDEVGERGIAWECGEFQEGQTCAAAPVRDAGGMVIGSVAVSGPDASYEGRRGATETALREAATRIGRAYQAAHRAL